MDHEGHHATAVQGELRVSAGIGFRIKVLAGQFRDFLLRYPKVDISLDLSSRPAELVSGHVDLAIRFRPLSDSSMVATKLGEMRRVLCVSPDYLERSGTPFMVDDLVDHETIEIPGWDGRARAPNLEVNVLFPDRRELAPAVSAFVDFMKEANQPGFHWQDDQLPGTA